MKREINISLREYCDIRALKIIMDYCKSCRLDVHWNLFNFVVNTDFNFCTIEQAFNEYPNVSISDISKGQLVGIKLFSFLTDMKHDCDQYVNGFISCAEINVCRKYHRMKSPRPKSRPRIVVGNLKVKSPIEAFQIEVLNRLALLPFEVIVVPRHPLEADKLEQLKLPEQIKFVNTMGQLEDLQASADLTIMGRIFSADGFKVDDEHNPLEATINSNTLCSGIMNPAPTPYEWLYGNSGLVHKCYDFEEVFNLIEPLMNDSDLPNKLAKRDRWVQRNRNRYLKKVRAMLGL